MAVVKISELPAVDALVANDLIPIRDTSTSVTKSATGQQVIDLVAPNMVDSAFRIIGSSDATKKVAFEVDGLTTATTRTLTTPDRDLTLGLTLGTEQATTSGTEKDFTSLPSWIRRITVYLNEISSNGTSAFRLQIGDSGGLETSGYAGSVASSTPATNVWSTASGIDLNVASVAAGLYSGVVVLTLMNVSTNTWAVYGVLTRTDGTPLMFTTTGRKALSAVLDRLRLTTVNGTDAFDAGAVNIAYE